MLSTSSVLRRVQQIAPSGGRSLRELLARGERPDRATLVDWGCQLLEILDEAHARGFFYPHLTEDDVVILPEGRLVLTGFGLTRFAFGPRATPPTEPLVGRPYRGQSDLYAVGSLLRRLAFAGAVRGGSGSFGSRDPLLKVLARATFADPAARYRSATDMAEALREAGRSEAVAVSRHKDSYAGSGGRVTPFPGTSLRLLPPPSRPAALWDCEDPDWWQALLVLVASLLLITFVLATGWFLFGQDGGFTWPDGEPLARSLAAPAAPALPAAGFP